MHVYDEQRFAFVIDPVLWNQDHKVYSAVTVRRRRRSRWTVKVKRPQYPTSLLPDSHFLALLHKGELFSGVKGRKQ